MAVDRAWVVRNLGLSAGEALLASVSPEPADDDALIAELMDFDSESPSGQAFLATASQATGLSRFVDIAWPKGLAPTPGPRPTGESLPKCDVLIVTWTVEEGHALSRVLTPGFDSRNDWQDYTKNFDVIGPTLAPLSPARQAGRLGTYWTTEIGSKTVVLFKSDSHMSRDGSHQPMPNATVWKQIIRDSRPDLVITTGTGGGIGAAEEVGDVIVSRFVTFDCQKVFASLDGQTYSSATPVPAGKFRTAKRLFGANAQFLPRDNPRAPRIVQARSRTTGILTTDFFGFDNTANTYKLQGKGALSEMGDAVLGMVCAQLGASAPPYVIVRNVSDPEIDSTGETLAQQKDMAGKIYKAFGRWSSVCSAIACWAIVADS